MPIEDKIRHKKIKSWTELLRIYESERLAKDDKEEKMSTFQETLALHEEFAKDVRRAKSKIRKVARREFEKAPESKLVPVVVFP